ncbi:carboxylic acid reductase [Pelomyxa schiedti]|nr:carboxylic acid reductase [Pelomyxa schiedti]
MGSTSSSSKGEAVRGVVAEKPTVVSPSPYVADSQDISSGAFLCDCCGERIYHRNVRYTCCECRNRLESISFDICVACMGNNKFWEKHLEEIHPGKQFSPLVLDPSVILTPNAQRTCAAEALRACMLLFRECPLFAIRCTLRDPSNDVAGGSASPLGSAAYSWVTYQEVYSASRSLASNMIVECGLKPQMKVALFAGNSVGWCTVCFACIFAGAILVPLPAGKSAGELGSQCVADCEPSILFCTHETAEPVCKIVEAVESVRWVVLIDDTPQEKERTYAQLNTSCTSICNARGGKLVCLSDLTSMTSSAWTEIVTRQLDDVMMLMYTSGSSGKPKGAMVPDRYVHTDLMKLARGLQPVILLFMPLAFSSQFRMLIGSMAGCGKLVFSSGNAGTLLEELRDIKPTFIQAPPCVWVSLHSQFLAEMERLCIGKTTKEERHIVKEQLRKNYSSYFGNKLSAITTGGAPTPPHVMKWLYNTFYSCDVHEGYGATEVGGISRNGYLLPGVEVRLQDCPEMGYFSTDTPPRGILWVRTTEMMLGYFNNPRDTNENFSSDNFFCTGDVVEYEKDKRAVHIIDRAKFAVKLCQNVFVYADSFLPCVLAAAVVNFNVLRQRAGSLGITETFPDTVLCTTPSVVSLIRADFILLGSQANLLPHEIPRVVLLESDAWTTENGFLTPTMKKNRRVLSEKYGPILKSMYETSFDVEVADSVQLSPPGNHLVESTDDAFFAQANQVMERILGAGSFGLDAPLKTVGIDSVTAVRLSAVLNKIFDLRTPLSPQSFLDSKITLRQLLKRHRDERLHSTSNSPFDWASECELSMADLYPCSPQPYPCSGSFFLTGATGFVGSYILQALIANTTSQVFCLVRTTNGVPPCIRLEQQLSKYKVNLPNGVKCCDISSFTSSDRIICFGGDISEFHFGLKEAEWNLLVTQVTCIIHNAAVTSSIQPYSQLRAPNVHGTVQAIKLACSVPSSKSQAIPPKRLVYVSSISVYEAQELSRGKSLKERVISECGHDMNAYGRTKRTSEILINHARERLGLDAVMCRLGTVAGSCMTGALNSSDTVNRLLGTFYQLRAVPYLTSSGDEKPIIPMAPAEWVAESICKIAIDRDSCKLGVFHIVGPSVTLSACATALESVLRLQSPQQQNSAESVPATSPDPKVKRLLYREWSHLMYKTEECALWPMKASFCHCGVGDGITPCHCQGLPFLPESQVLDQTNTQSILLAPSQSPPNCCPTGGHNINPSPSPSPSPSPAQNPAVSQSTLAKYFLFLSEHLEFIHE